MAVEKIKNPATKKQTKLPKTTPVTTAVETLIPETPEVSPLVETNTDAIEAVPAPLVEGNTGSPQSEAVPLVETKTDADKPDVSKEKSRELTTAQKVSHFKKKVEGISKLAAELAAVDNRFREVGKLTKSIIKLIDPGALVQSAAVKSMRRQETEKPVIQKSVVRPERKPVLQAVPTQTRPVARPMSVGKAGQSTPGGFNTTKPGPKIPFRGVKKKV